MFISEVGVCVAVQGAARRMTAQHGRPLSGTVLPGRSGNIAIAADTAAGFRGHVFPPKMHSIPRSLLACVVGAFVLVAAAALHAQAPKKTLKMGFAQTGAESAWRTANTLSMKTEAEKRGIDLKFSDGQGKQENQIRAVRSFITQGVDAIIIAPIVSTGWDPVLREAKRAHIPVILTDRAIATEDESLFACFIGSDFNEEGRMAAEWLAKHSNGRGNIVELQGTPGSDPANERRKAFAEGIAKYPGLKIIDSQSGNFERSQGKVVMEALLKKHGPSINILYAHNDDMALGAIQAIEAAAMKPGKDIMIVTIDAIKEAIQAVIDGKINCTVECNPLFGPRVYDTVGKILAGEKVPKKIYNKDELFDSTNAATAIASRQY
jgi:simple sugar transport system substrate-binding protein